MTDKPVRLRLCGDCDGGAAARDQIRTALDAADLGSTVGVDIAPCMDACDAPVPLALQGEGRATYLFEGVAAQSDLDDIVATCRAYLDAPAGWIEDARPCGRLRFCLRTRVPAPGQAAG